MRLDVLGSSGTAPTHDNPASGFLVSSEGTTLWMDAGPGTYMALLGLVDQTDVDAVLISHMHPDHCSDLFAFFHGLKYMREPTEAVPVVVPDGSINRISGFLQADPDHAVFQTLAFHEAQPGETLRFGTIDVVPMAARHSVPAFVYRVESAGGSLGYTGDTGPSEMVSAHFAGVGTILAEASLANDDRYPFHMTGRQAGQLAATSGSEQLILTHLRETMDAESTRQEAANVFGGTVSLAQPGDVYMI